MGHVGIAKQGCQVHKDHRPNIESPEGFNIQVHHIHPLGEGGKDTPSNCIRVCPTGHDRIHHLIRVLWKNEGDLPTGWARKFHPKEVELAERGYRAIVKWRKAQGILVDPAGSVMDTAGTPKIEVKPVDTGTTNVEGREVRPEIFAGAMMVNAYKAALNQYEERVGVTAIMERILNQMQVFWNVVWTFVIVNVVLDVGPAVYQAFAESHWPDWSKVGFAAAKAATGGLIAYFVRFRKVEHDSSVPEPPKPPVPVPDPEPQPEDPEAGD